MAAEGEGQLHVVQVTRTAQGFGFAVLAPLEQAGPVFCSALVAGGPAGGTDLDVGDRIMAVNGADTAMATKGN